MNGSTWRTSWAIAATAAALAIGIVAAPAEAALKHYDGTVLGKSASASTFRIKTQSGEKVRFEVDGRTQFERIPGDFRGLERGLAIEVDAKRTAGGLVARNVEPKNGGNGGNGGNGNDDRRDDRPRG